MSVYAYTISYAGVELPFCNISYSGRAEYDSVGHTLSGYAMTFKGTFTATASSPDLLNGEIGTYVAALSRPRRRFTWKAGSEVLWDIGSHADGAATNRDARYGPRPRMISVSRLAGGISARIEFEIEAFIYLCANYPNPVEEFSWSFAYSFDRNFVCTRRIRGIMRVQAPLNAASRFLPQGSMFPAILEGFYRESAEHSLSADGLTLNWSITDKQAWRTLPRPLTGGHAEFRVDCIGAMIRKSLNCQFEAPPDTDKSVIAQFILALIQSRFPDIFSRFNERVVSLSITNHEFDNRMAASVVTETGAATILSGKSSPVLTATDSGSITAATAGRLAFDLFGDIKDVRPNRRPVVAADGTVSWVSEDRGDQFTASDGVSASRGMTGTTGLVPTPAPYFDRCTTTNPKATDLPAADGSAISPGESQGAAYEASSLAIDGSQTPATDAGLIAPERPNENPGETTVLSEQHANYPYLSYTELWQFAQDFNAVLLKVPYAAADDVVQRAAYPSTRLIQMGSARRLNYPPEVPPPAYINPHVAATDASASRAQLATREVRLCEPHVGSDGRSVEWRATWRYEIILPGVRSLVGKDVAESTTDMRLRHPANPMFSDEHFKDNLDAPADLSADGKINSDGTYRAQTDNRKDS